MGIPGGRRGGSPGGPLAVRKKRPNLSLSTQGTFLYPAGVDLYEGENYRQREGYEVRYLKDDEFPRYQFTIAASMHRAGALFRRLLALMGDPLCAILEVPAADEAGPMEPTEPPDEWEEEPEGPEEPRGEPLEPGLERCDIWMSPELPARRILRAFTRYEQLFLHDGMIGFGALSPVTSVELVLDDDKLFHFYTADLEKPEEVLSHFGIPAVDVLRHFSDLTHAHHALVSYGLGEDYRVAFEELCEDLDMTRQTSRPYS